MSRIYVGSTVKDLTLEGKVKGRNGYGYFRCQLCGESGILRIDKVSENPPHCVAVE